MSLPADEEGFLLHVLQRGRRTHRTGGSETCRCGAPKAKTRWLCNRCYAAYRRDYRSRWPDPPRQGEALLRSRARSYANTYLRRGKLERQPCASCGGPAQMHHRDFSKPLEVTWMCTPDWADDMEVSRALRTG